MKNIPLILGFLLISFSGLFAQNTLGDYIDSALLYSPALFENRNNIIMAENSEKLFRAGQKTQIGFATDLMVDPILGGYGYDEVITNGQMVSTLVNFDKSILFKDQLQDNLRALEIRKNQAGNQLQLTKVTLVREVTSMYLTAWGDLLQWKYNSEILHTLTGEDSILNRLTLANIYRVTDYYSFTANMKSQELAVSNALLQYRQALMQLRSFAGIPDTAFVELEPPEMQIPGMPSKSASVFFRQFSLDSLRLQNHLDLISLEYQPKLSLHADAGYLSSLVPFPYKNFGAGLGLKLTVPIYDGRQKEIKYHDVTLQQENNRQREIYFERQYNLKLARYSQMLTDLESQAGDIDRLVEFYRTLMREEQKLFTTGQLDITQYFMIIRNYVDARNESAINHVKRMMLVNEIRYLAN